MKRTFIFLLLLITTSLPLHAESKGPGFDLESLALFAQQWLGECIAPTWCNGADYNQDGTVNLNDFGQYVNNWMSPVMLLRNATGHGSVNIYDVPDVGVTNGNQGTGGYRVSSGSDWFATGIRFSIEVPTRITGFGAVGGDTGSDAMTRNNMAFAFRVHTSESAFSENPFNGDDIDASGKTLDWIGIPRSELILHGVGPDEAPRYYLTLGLDGSGDDFTLLPGDYVISISDHASLIGRWLWSTSDKSLPTTDIFSHRDMPGEYDEFTDWGETITAIDIYGYPDYTVEHKIRSATGYPDVSKTNGSEGIGSYWLGSNSWIVSAHRISIEKPTEITKISGIGGSPNSDALWLPSVPFWINVHSAHDGLTKEDSFGAYPYRGNIVESLGIGNTSSFETFGMNSENNKNYYITFNLINKRKTFIIQPGDYIISVYQSGGITGVWGWATNSGAGYNDIGSAFGMPEGMEWFEFSDYNIDPAAVDIYGRVVE